MKIMHIDLTGPFMEGMNYQENLLPAINVQDGHEVFFIATNYIWNHNKMEKVPTGETITDEGFHLIRMPYQSLLFPVLTEKMRIVRGLNRVLENCSPEVIMLHCYHTLSVFPIIKYLKYHKNVRLVVDSHADKYNSAQSLLSKCILHRLIYAQLAGKVLRYTEKIWCISYDAMKYTEEISRIPMERLEFYPLGGKIFSQTEYDEKRKKIRHRHGYTEENIVLMHSGKMDIQKKTNEIFQAMEKIKDDRLRLIIAGSMDEEIKVFYEKTAKRDKRIDYVGWKKGEELLEYLCSADLYMQPGTQSATMQNGACCKCALALYPYESHKYLLGESAFYIKDIEDIINLLKDILKQPQLIQQKREEVFTIAQEKLDYRKLAARIYD